MMTLMRTTIRIDDELLEKLRHQAQREKISLTRLLNRMLRRGLRAPPANAKPRYREKPYPMGQPSIPLDKALSVAAALEDEEILRKLMLRK